VFEAIGESDDLDWNHPLDSHSVKTTESGGPHGFDAGKKVKGRKRHIVTDTQGKLLCGIVHAANVQDRDGAPAVVSLASASYPTVAHLFADGGYAGEKLENALQKIEGPAIEIVGRSDGATGFAIVARRCHDFSSSIVDSAPLSSEKVYTSPT
jgi:hypothetical protein